MRDPVSFSAVDKRMEDAVRRGVFPGAVLLVREGSRVFYLRAFGRRSSESDAPPMRETTVFDLSSLTKPLATTVAVMLLVQEGKIRLDDKVTRLFPNFGVHGKTPVTFRHLLSHCSGLPAWRPYYRQILDMEQRGGRVNFVGSGAAREYVMQQIEREVPECPPGRKAIYSDLGFLLLGAAVEAVGGLSLDQYCAQRIFRPLGLPSLTFIDLSLVRARQLQPVTDRIAPTERCSWRRRVLCGEVHDDNAGVIGGVAGHAGLFGSARDIDTLVARLQQCYEGADSFVAPEVVKEFWTRDATVPGSTWALGWDSPAAKGSAAGKLFSPHTIGHLGFTGTSLWVDLERDRTVILLSNRVHPSRGNEKIRRFRPAIHDLVNQALDGAGG